MPDSIAPNPGQGDAPAAGLPPSGPRLPGRFRAPSIISSVAFTAFVGLLVWSLQAADISLTKLWDSLPNIGILASEMWPPVDDAETLSRMAGAMFATISMAVVGTVAGVLISLPLGVLAAWNHTPHVSVYGAVRSLVTLCRTVPDLVWALLFGIIIGLGPTAGMLAIMMDTIGFCGRFFAEDMEEVDPAAGTALAAIGGGGMTRLACATLPAAAPAMVNDSLYAFEKAIRSSVILGLVGAGGIGVELEVSFQMFRYAEATTIILMMFLVVVVAEQCSGLIRRRLLGFRR